MRKRWIVAGIALAAVVASLLATTTGTPPRTTADDAGRPSQALLAGAAGQRPGLTPCTVERVAAPVYCGSIEVPESPEQPSGRRLRIRVIVAASPSQSPAPDPMIFLAGGPGQAAASLAGPLTERMAFLRDERDLILIDQRGTGQSNPLTCPPPPGAHDLMGRIFDPTRLAACRDDLATRADLRRYTTSAAVPDYEAVLDALGIAQVNVWGVSYGTRLGLELARRLPQRVRTLTLEAVVPPSFAWPTTGARDADAALTAVIEDCEQAPACAGAYPAFRKDVDRAFAAVAGRTLAVTVRDPLTRERREVPFATSDLAYAVRGLLYGQDAWNLPRLFRDAASGNVNAFAQAYVTRARTLGDDIATGVHLGVYCAEDMPHADLAKARQIAVGTRTGTYLIDQYQTACGVWPQAPLTAGFRDPVRSPVPTLIMTGRRDPVTPPWTAHDAAATLERARVVTWPFGGHGYDGQSDPSCKRSLIREFVTTAAVHRLATDCVSEDAAQSW